METVTPSPPNAATRYSCSGDAEVRILRSLQEVESIRTFWCSCPGTLDSDIDVFFAGHTETPGVAQPRVLVLYRGGAPAALLAGKIVRRQFVFRIGWLPVFRPLVSALEIPRGGLRGDASPENCRLLVRALVGLLKRGEADLAFVPGVEADSDLYRSLKREPGFLLRDHFAPLRPHRKRKLAATVEEFYCGLSYNERQHFRKIARRLARRFSGQVQVSRFIAPADFDLAFCLAEQIASKTWQRSFRRGFDLANKALIASLRSQGYKGWLQVRILKLGEKPCAYSIGTLYQETFYHLHTGYDPDYVEHSPGVYLLLRLMEDLCAERVQVIDFGPSEQESKKRFGNVIVQEADLHVFAPTAMGLALSVMNSITIALRGAARTVLERADLVQRAKREWRTLSLRRARAREARRKENTHPGRKRQPGVIPASRSSVNDADV